jgi:hypothetical protein
MLKCAKCRGWISMVRLEDFYYTFVVWRCLNCGEMVDRTILSNRRKWSEPKKRRENKYDHFDKVSGKIRAIKSVKVRLKPDNKKEESGFSS